MRGGGNEVHGTGQGKGLPDIAATTRRIGEGQKEPARHRAAEAEAQDRAAEPKAAQEARSARDVRDMRKEDFRCEKDLLLEHLHAGR